MGMNRLTQNASLNRNVIVAVVRKSRLKTPLSFKLLYNARMFDRLLQVKQLMTHSGNQASNNLLI